MQLILLTILSFLLSSVLVAQKSNDNIKKTEIDIFAGYYEQDGDHSAVEGGIGTQELTCFEPTVFIHVIPDSVQKFDFNFGIDAFTSASTGMIDKYPTSASPDEINTEEDTRVHFGFQYTRKFINHSITPKIGYSTEWDVNSLSAGLKYSYLFNNDNTELSVGYEYFYDTWLLIYPSELRNMPDYAVQGDDQFDTDVRQTNVVSFVYSQVLTKKIQFALLVDYVSQKGILYTPFHRVYFDDGVLLEYEQLKRVEAEFLPASRYKVPVAARVNWFINDFLITNVYYRYYYDNFGIKGNTIDLSLAIKLGVAFTINPFYRYYNQSASTYFAGYGKHTLDDNNNTTEFYTSDYDLSEFNSHKYGLGVKFAPVYGVGRAKFPSKKRLTVLKSIELRYANYQQSHGLSANILSFMMSFSY